MPQRRSRSTRWANPSAPRRTAGSASGAARRYRSQPSASPGPGGQAGRSPACSQGSSPRPCDRAPSASSTCGWHGSDRPSCGCRARLAAVVRHRRGPVPRHAVQTLLVPRSPPRLGSCRSAGRPETDRIAERHPVVMPVPQIPPSAGPVPPSFAVRRRGGRPQPQQLRPVPATRRVPSRRAGSASCSSRMARKNACAPCPRLPQRSPAVRWRLRGSLRHPRKTRLRADVGRGTCSGGCARQQIARSDVHGEGAAGTSSRQTDQGRVSIRPRERLRQDPSSWPTRDTEGVVTSRRTRRQQGCACSASCGPGCGLLCGRVRRYCRRAFPSGLVAQPLGFHLRRRSGRRRRGPPRGRSRPASAPRRHRRKPG